MKKRNIIYAVIIVAFFVLVSCNSKKEKYTSKTKVDKTEEKLAEHLGEKLLRRQCYVCHNPSASHNSIVAPPMIAIKAHYINKNTTKEEFTKAFVDFVTKPTNENAKLRGAVRRFGLMPIQNYKEDDLKLIADYLFDYQIDEPKWFKEHWQEMQGRSYINSGKTSEKSSSKTKADIGLEYALATKKVLGKNLMGKIQKEGTLEALKFCNEKAYHLTDSMATKFNATIKRVSDKPRNPKNKANKKEIEIINQYKNSVSANESIEPVVEESNGKTQFYYPIITNSMCLQCHGKSNDQIKPSVLNELANLYPQDKAKGYSENQVRGIWSITFNN